MSDAVLEKSAQNEIDILKAIDCELVNKAVAFYEDLLVNKAYLVLEKAGDKTLTEYMSNIKFTTAHSQAPRGLRDDELRSIML